MAVTLGERCPVTPAGRNECQGKGHDEDTAMVKDEPAVRDHLEAEVEAESQYWFYGVIRGAIVNVTMLLW